MRRIATSAPKMKYFSQAKPFFAGSNGERTFNDNHPVLAVLTFCTIFGAGAGSFQVVKTVYETVVQTISISFECNEVSSVDISSFDE
jgi:hypothetical protein